MYTFYPQLLLRTPAYCHRSYNATALPGLLKSSFFQAAIQLASPSLYQELRKYDFEREALPPRVLFGLKKYLNRMCLRPTPFGLFSGFSLVNWLIEDTPEGVMLGANLPHTALSFQETLRRADELLTGELAPFQTFRTNSSCYKNAGEYRFLRYEQHRQGGHRQFFIDAVGDDPLLTSLLNYCHKARTREEIINFTSNKSGAAPASCAAFFEQLVGQQLLVSSLQPNITGEDYLHRLRRVCQEKNIDTPRTRDLQATLLKLQAVGQEEGGQGILQLLDQLGAAAALGQSPLYVNLEKQVLHGGLPADLQQKIRQAMEALERLLPMHEPPALQRFREAFTRRFDRRAVPLLEALDPELGVGYEELAGSSQIARLLQGMDFDSQQEGARQVDWTPAHALLLNKWHTATGIPVVLELTEEDIARLPAPPAGVLPPSSTVVFRIVQGQVYLEQAGGISACALLGRFTPLRAEVRNMAAAIARQEQEASAEVVFADIAYLCDEHTANIDRRCAVRTYEIPILVQAGKPEEHQIPLQDLVVVVEGDQLMLWSARLQKRVIPRLGSAFNYVRDDLAVFRFLCDLQYQGLRANFSLDLSSFFPDLSFYPRVSYCGTILSLASWHLSSRELAPVLGAARESQWKLLKQKATALGWPRHIALTQHDNQLVFDLEKEEEALFFLENARQMEKVTVKEFPFLAEEKPLVKDAAGQPYVHQFMTALIQRQPVYRGIDPPLVYGSEHEQKRRFVPGGEWLYLKLYCHPVRANQVLAEELLPVLEKLVRQGEAKQWFFIRYRDPGYHVRLRVQTSAGTPGAVLLVLSQVVDRMLQEGSLQDVQLAVYERELERYGAELIEAVEEVFCAGSALVVRFIKEAGLQETAFDYYRFVCYTSDSMLDAFGLDLPEKVELLEGLYRGFYQEHGATKALREQLSRKYREMRQELGELTGEEQEGPLTFRGSRKLLHHFLKSLQRLARLAATVPPARKQLLLADLLHMHLNRLLTDQARRQELVIYYCLWKHYQSVQARTANGYGSSGAIAFTAFPGGAARV